MTKKISISLKKLNYIISAVTIVIAVLLLISIYFTGNRYTAVRETTDNYLSWQKTAEKLQTASDYLTEQVRAFSVTGEKEYCDNYFYEAKVTKTRDNTLSALEEHIRNTEAYTFLRDAMNKSLELMNREYYSMRLVVESRGCDVNDYPDEIKNVEISPEDEALSNDAKARLAESMVFDEVYKEYKNEITKLTQKCLSDLAEYSEDNMNESFGRLSAFLLIQQILIVIILLVIAINVALTSRQVINPLIRAIPKIKDEEPLPLDGAYEYNYLAKPTTSCTTRTKGRKRLRFLR